MEFRKLQWHTTDFSSDNFLVLFSEFKDCRRHIETSEPQSRNQSANVACHWPEMKLWNRILHHFFPKCKDGDQNVHADLFQKTQRTLSFSFMRRVSDWKKNLQLSEMWSPMDRASDTCGWLVSKTVQWEKSNKELSWFGWGLQAESRLKWSIALRIIDSFTAHLASIICWEDISSQHTYSWRSHLL